MPNVPLSILVALASSLFGNATESSHGNVAAPADPAHGAVHHAPVPAPAAQGTAAEPTDAHPATTHPTVETEVTSHETPAGTHTAPSHPQDEDKAAHGVPEGHAPAPEPPLPRVFCGRLPRDAVVWEAAMGPLTLAGDVLVDSGQSLELGPGTRVRIAERDACPQSGGGESDASLVGLLVASGSLRVLGTPDAPVRFEPLRAGKDLAWSGIRAAGIRRRDDFQVRWAHLPRATTGIALIASPGLVAHVSFEACGIGVDLSGGSLAEIRNNGFDRSVAAGIRSRRSAATLHSNLFVNGEGDGIRFEGLGLTRFSHNAFWNHRGRAIRGGPAGAGAWRADSLIAPDRYGNWGANPVLRVSRLHAALAQQKAAERADLPWYAPVWQRKDRQPRGRGFWALSPWSPLVDRGPDGCREPDGSRCDIGLWGGPD